MRKISPSEGRKSNWLITSADSVIDFTVEFLTLTTASGRLKRFKGLIQFDEANPTESTVEATIDAGSIDTGDPTRDAHLRSSDFFDVARFPTMHFQSRRILAEGGVHYTVLGDLTIHGVTQPVELAITYQGLQKDFFGKWRARFLARARVTPPEFGLTWNEDMALGWVPVGDHVEIVIEVTATRIGAHRGAIRRGLELSSHQEA